LHDFDATLKALEGCDGVIHLAGHRSPGDYKATTHNRYVSEH
jgi:nucleoside-diphosphate-sugar epimerase